MEEEERGQGERYEVGLHTWPATDALANYLSINRSLFQDKCVLELGSGATGVCGIVAAKSGARRVYCTDADKTDSMLARLKKNLDLNDVSEQCTIRTLDWAIEESLEKFIVSIGEQQIDWIIGSDIFFDPAVFLPLMQTLGKLLSKYPKAQLIFSFEKRDSSWSLEEFLAPLGLAASLVRSKEESGKTIEIGVIYRNREQKIVAGVEGGASFTRLVLLRAEDGTEIQSYKMKQGTNYYLSGVQKAADDLALFIRESMARAGIVGPLDALGMGLSGAEDASLNEQMVDYLLSQHGDIAQSLALESDSVATVAACFGNDGGAVVIAGTGSSTRLLLPGGKILAVGGWGHAVGDGGSGYWIANLGMRKIFDVEDGVEEGNIDKLREVMFAFFGVTDKVHLLDFLYAKFDKSKLASVTAVLAKHVSDPVISSLFFEGGRSLGRQMHALIKKIPETHTEKMQDINVLLIGSVFESWSAVKDGFACGLAIESLACRKVSLFRGTVDAAVGAAVLGASHALVPFPFTSNVNSKYFDAIQREGS